MKVTIPEGNKAGIVKAICRFINYKEEMDYQVGTVGLSTLLQPRNSA